MATSDKRELLLRVKVDDDASRPLKNIGDAADDTKDELNDMNVGLKKLDGQMAEATKTVAGLRHEIAKTGDLELIKDISKQEARLKALARQRKSLLGDVGMPDFSKAGADGAEKFSVSFMQRIGPLLAKSPIPMPLVAALAAPVAIGVSATIAGAVVGGVGIGGVIGGFAIASKHADVQRSAQLTGDTFKTVMQRSAVSFVPATVNALDDVRDEILSMEGDFKHVFGQASRYVAPLTAGVTGFAKNLMPGVKDAIDQAGPIIDELAAWGPRLGTLLSDVFSDFSEHTMEGARALASFWLVFETGVRIVAGTITALSAVYGWMDKSLALLRGDLGTLAKYAAEEGAAKEGGDALIPTLQGIINGFGKTEQKTTDAVTALREWREELDKMTGTNLDARAAQRELESAIDDATAAVVENGKTAINHGTALDINSAKGRANAAALDSIARESNDAYDAIMTQTGSQELANAAADRGRAKFIELAMKMGLSSTAAQILADELINIKDRNVKVTADTRAALAAAQALQARINNMSARINVFAEPSGGFGGGKGTGFGYSTGYAEGGPIRGLPGPRGVDSGYIKAANDEHMITADEVAAAGGHGAVEAWRRSLLSGRRAPAMAGGGSGGGQQLQVVVKLDASAVSDQSIIGALLRAIKTSGGNPGVLGVGGRW